MKLLQWLCTTWFLICLASGRQFRIVDDKEIQLIMDRLQQADVNAAGPNDTLFNYQSHISKGKAAEKFIPFVRREYLEKPTVASFLSLMSEFNPNVGKAERLHKGKEVKIDKFLAEVLKTKVMNLTRDFFKSIGHPGGDSESKLKEWLKNVWFGNFDRRRGLVDSSAFEHVFLGELRDDEVTGLHNWIRFAYLESIGAVDYVGFILERQDSSATIKYKWDGRTKNIGTMLLGPSPEFDMAMFSICYVQRPGGKPCKFYYKNCEVIINTYELQRRANKHLSTAFPKAGQTCRLPPQQSNFRRAQKLKQD